MPRQMRGNEFFGAAREVSEVATIKVRFREAVFVRTESRPRAGPRATTAQHDTVNKNAAKLAKSESVSRAGDAVFAAPGRAEFAGCTRVNMYNYGPRLAELVFHYGTISNLRAKGVDIGDIYETPKPAWWRQAYEYVGSFFRRAPAPKRKREDDDGPPPKKKVASDAQVTALLREVRQAVRQADENLSAPVEDDDDVVDLTV